MYTFSIKEVDSLQKTTEIIGILPATWTDAKIAEL
jgi:hypothetical protein